MLGVSSLVADPTRVVDQPSE
ncbi:hypothetical protein HU200_058375 [Digitaria exilis]|uniref:Uncharacterized protein n=1 Tax=Digitaria exilis TaxID=1010633 RepID=A0A835ADL8_9POAL|nr:hypothetical protein HU200_058375 [Digitaria exilis]